MYLCFSGKKDSVIRAYDALVVACNKAKLHDPTRITSTTLRKYMATITQVWRYIIDLTLKVFNVI